MSDAPVLPLSFTWSFAADGVVEVTGTCGVFSATVTGVCGCVYCKIQMERGAICGVASELYRAGQRVDSELQWTDFFGEMMEIELGWLIHFEGLADGDFSSAHFPECFGGVQ